VGFVANPEGTTTPRLIYSLSRKNNRPRGETR
jgi:hypothetical protein